jgi:hypothetical protein
MAAKKGLIEILPLSEMRSQILVRLLGVKTGQYPKRGTGRAPHSLRSALFTSFGGVSKASELGIHSHGREYGFREVAHPGMKEANPFPTPSG